jgi:hypothetical protein
MSGFNDVNGILRRILNKYGLTDQLIQLDVMENYETIFPGLISKNSSPVSVKNGTMMIKVNNSVIRNELKFQQDDIIEKLNTYLGTRYIKKIRLV